MAAHLDFTHLRRHASPAYDSAGFDSAATRPIVHEARARLRLFAAWHVGVDGRLACTWSATPDDPG